MSEVLFFLPARGGSTRVNDKNIKPLGGKPLIHYAIQSALATNRGRVLVSTNDEAIADVAKREGAEVPFLRPQEISEAKSKVLSALLYTLDTLRSRDGYVCDTLVFRPPTNPFFLPATLQKMLDYGHEHPNVKAVYPVCPALVHPFELALRDSTGRLRNESIQIEGKNVNQVPRTQDWPEVWRQSPGVKVIQAVVLYELLEEFPFPFDCDMPLYSIPENSSIEVSALECFDINVEDDFAVAEELLPQYLNLLNA